MERPFLRTENRFGENRQLSEKQFNLLLSRFDCETICGFTYERASKEIGKIIDDLRFGDEIYSDFYQGLPNM